MVKGKALIQYIQGNSVTIIEGVLMVYGLMGENSQFVVDGECYIMAENKPFSSTPEDNGPKYSPIELTSITEPRMFFCMDTVVEIMRREGITADSRDIGISLSNLCDKTSDYLFVYDYWDKEIRDKYYDAWLGKESCPSKSHVYLVAVEHLPVLVWKFINWKNHRQ